jgi:TPR repeat protein
MNKDLSDFLATSSRLGTANFIAEPARVPFLRRRRWMTIIKVVSRFVCLVLFGIVIALMATPSFATPPHAQAETTPLTLGLAALKRGDNQQAIRHFRPLADQGNVSAQFTLAMVYAAQAKTALTATAKAKANAKAGHFMDLAHHFMAKAAAQGHREALFRLGTQYAYGLGVEHNVKKARIFFTIAAHRHHLDAQHNLAILLAAKQTKTRPVTRKWTGSKTDSHTGNTAENLAGRGTKRGVKTHQKTRILAYKWALIALQNAAPTTALTTALTTAPTMSAKRLIKTTKVTDLARLAQRLRHQLTHGDATIAAAARRFYGTAI